ncbi:MAG TPA: hypothetical protein VMC86_08840 [Gemmatimonadales bacterium]|nr:hypothetical protein [Gemmatimonadales bacterium]
MSATATPSTGTLTDRTELPHILMSGTKLGILTALFVVLYLLIWRFVPGMAGQLLESAVVLAGGLAMALLPAQWTAARHTEGIAGAAGVGLFSSVVFMAIDIVVLRPVHAYPWTWDAIGGNSTWWYLPVWWQLGTFISWQGAMFTAGRSAKAPAGVGGLAVPLVIGAVVLGIVARVLGFGFTQMYPVAIGFGFAVTLTVLGVAAIARKA